MKLKIRLSDGMKDVAKISSGTVLGQIISILSLPLITRIYGPEVIGNWALIFANAMLINSVSDLGISQSIMIREKSDTKEIYSVIIFLAAVITTILSIFIYGYFRLILQNSMSATMTIVLFSGLFAFITQLVQFNYTWLNKNSAYSILMQNPLINKSSMAIFTIIFGIMGYREYGYYIGLILSELITLIHMFRKKEYKLYFEWPSFHVISKVLKQNIEFIKYQAPTNITLQFTEQIPNLIIGALFGRVMLGYYSISQKILNIPITFIGQALGKVFYQRLAELKAKGKNIKHYIYNAVTKAMKLAFLPMLLFAAFGDAAVIMFFGEDYAIGGLIARIIVFRSFFVFISTATRGMDIVLHKQKYFMIVCIVQTIVTSISVFLSYYWTNSIIICVLSITVTYILIQISYFGFIFKILNISFVKYIIGVAISIALILVLSQALRMLFIYVTRLSGNSMLLYLLDFIIE